MDASSLVGPQQFEIDASRDQEWVVTNGRGGYAMASVTGLLTRRYHGLLVAAIKPPADRFVLLAKLEATVVVDGLTYDLSTNDYPETVHPRGYKLLDSFRPRPFPLWRWRAGDALIEQSLCMARGEDTTFIRFRLLAGPPTVRISVRPLGTSRHFHSLMRYRDIGPPVAESNGDSLTLNWSGNRPSWRLSHNGVFKPKPDWYYEFMLRAEADRGQDCAQDLFTPGIVNATLEKLDSIGLVFAASTEPRSWRDADAAFAEASRSPANKCCDSDDTLLEPLTRAAADFLVTRDDGNKTIVAGYPWFEDWGRDTFISLPGLCLVTDRHREAREIIYGYARYIDGGMIPNRFPPFNEPPAYNTADASLWYLHALDRYLTYSQDWDFLSQTMYTVATEILTAHERGTRHGIGMREDGLLAAGVPGLQLTWMDAKIGDWVVTPRIGKPVEINALWYNALLAGAAWADRQRDATRARHWRGLAERAYAAFNLRFWNEGNNCLNDVVDVNHESGTVDSSIRPNQLFAISLTHPVLDRSHWRPVVQTCEQRLWTPMGMRTLAPGSPNYAPHYQGDMAARDGAYHQGTAWPWLLGSFATAYVRAHDASPASITNARRFLACLEPHLSKAGLGGISECADAEPPHNPGGCPWQAWSVAEPLRTLCEDILKTHPQPPPTKSAARPHAVPAAS